MSRSKPGEIPQIKHYKTRNLACIYIDGRRHYLGPWVTPVPAAYEEERLRLWTEHVAGQKNPREARERVSVAVLVDRFLDHAEKTYRKNGRSTGSAERFVYTVRPLLELYARAPVDEFTPGALKAVRQHMLDTGWTTKFVDGTESERREYSRSLLNDRMGLIRQIFRWGVENGLVEVSTLSALETVAPLRKGQSLAAERPRVRPVPDSVVDATIPYLPIGVDGMVDLQRLTGMRPGEVVAMRQRRIIGAEIIVDRDHTESHKTGRTARCQDRRPGALQPKRFSRVRPSTINTGFKWQG